MREVRVMYPSKGEVVTAITHFTPRPGKEHSALGLIKVREKHQEFAWQLLPVYPDQEHMCMFLLRLEDGIHKQSKDKWEPATKHYLDYNTYEELGVKFPDQWIDTVGNLRNSQGSIVFKA